ncbi:MAG: Ni/Fe-hydrogenase cytochrome b subunit [Terriglobia bacterium]
MKTISFPKLTFWRGLVCFIFVGGLYSTYVRFSQGLGASTALNDQFPWGIWIGFDILCGVALAAGGFTISACVYIFNIQRFKPIVRPTILTAFLGYLLVILALLFDLGRPYRIWHPLVMWNPRSVMFEVGWCVTLYTTVLALEFSPILLQRLKWELPLRIMKSLMIPLVILGVILSTLHQSSLGSLYLIVPQKLHPFWYSSLLPVFFYISALALGCAMTIFESFLSYRAFRKRLEIDLLADVAKVIVVALSVYFVLKLQDLAGKGILSKAFEPTYEARMFLAELILGIVAPIVLLIVPRIRQNHFSLFVSSILVILGFVMNRLNISISGMEAGLGHRYFPKWTELSVTLSIVALGFVLFRTAIKNLPVFPEEAPQEAKRVSTEFLAPVVLRQPLFSSTTLVLFLGGIFLFGSMSLAVSGILLRPAPAAAGSPVSEDPATLEKATKQLKLPEEINFPQGEGSPGKVTFRHTSHVDEKRPECTPCHLQRFGLLRSSGAPSSSGKKNDMHHADRCGGCHDGQTAFSTQKDCQSCHQGE